MSRGALPIFCNVDDEVCPACGTSPRCDFAPCGDPACLSYDCESHDACEPACDCDECRERELAELRALAEPPWITLTPNPRYL